MFERLHLFEMPLNFVSFIHTHTEKCIWVYMHMILKILEIALSFSLSLAQSRSYSLCRSLSLCISYTQNDPFRLTKKRERKERERREREMRARASYKILRIRRLFALLRSTHAVIIRPSQFSRCMCTCVWQCVLVSATQCSSTTIRTNNERVHCDRQAIIAPHCCFAALVVVAAVVLSLLLLSIVLCTYIWRPCDGVNVNSNCNN